MTRGLTYYLELTQKNNIKAKTYDPFTFAHSSPQARKDRCWLRGDAVRSGGGIVRHTRINLLDS